MTRSILSSGPIRSRKPKSSSGMRLLLVGLVRESRGSAAGHAVAVLSKSSRRRGGNTERHHTALLYATNIRTSRPATVVPLSVSAEPSTSSATSVGIDVWLADTSTIAAIPPRRLDRHAARLDPEYAPCVVCHCHGCIPSISLAGHHSGRCPARRETASLWRAVASALPRDIAPEQN